MIKWNMVIKRGLLGCMWDMICLKNQCYGTGDAYGLGRVSVGVCAVGGKGQAVGGVGDSIRFALKLGVSGKMISIFRLLAGEVSMKLLCMMLRL